MNLAFSLAGTSVQLTTQEESILAYGRDHFGDACGAGEAGPAEVSVELFCEHPTATARPRPPLADYAHWNAYSKGFRARDDRLVWWPQRRFPNLELETRWDGERLACRARFFPSVTLQEERELERAPHRRAALYRELTYFLFYFPVLWRRAVRDGLAPLHAAAAVRDGRAVVFVGAAGCGKSTLALLLCAQPGWRLLSENLCCTDGATVWACREPIVLKHPELAEIVSAASGLRLSPVDLALGEPGSVGHLAPDHRCESARAERLWFPVLAGPPSPRPLSHDQARHHLAFSLRNCWELEGYYRYASAMDLHYGTDGATTGPLERLLSSVPVELYPVDASAPLRESQRRLLEHVQSAASLSK